MAEQKKVSDNGPTALGRGLFHELSDGVGQQRRPGARVVP